MRWRAVHQPFHKSLAAHLASLNTCCLIGGRTFRVIMTLEEAGKKFNFSVDILKKSVSYGFIKIEDFILEGGKVGYGCAYLAGPRMVGCAILVQIPGYLVEVAADSAVLGGSLPDSGEQFIIDRRHMDNGACCVFLHGRDLLSCRMSAAGISGASRNAGFGEGTLRQVSREGQHRRIADFGNRRGREIFLSLPTTPRFEICQTEQAAFSGFIYLLRVRLRFCQMGNKKGSKSFSDLLLSLAAGSGWYSFFFVSNFTVQIICHIKYAHYFITIFTKEK